MEILASPFRLHQSKVHNTQKSCAGPFIAALALATTTWKKSATLPGLDSLKGGLSPAEATQRPSHTARTLRTPAGENACV